MMENNRFPSFFMVHIIFTFWQTSLYINPYLSIYTAWTLFTEYYVQRYWIKKKICHLKLHRHLNEMYLKLVSNIHFIDFTSQLSINILNNYYDIVNLYFKRPVMFKSIFPLENYFNIMQLFTTKMCSFCSLENIFHFCP